ncbi:primosomal replication protein N [Neisseria iguanae]|uniref:primosomal replication protein N n=1 Tax=Neisseria iguanae TaxID=90242 RepID=UPI001B80E477|nr:primosomal replication protein N [Neisseria iguanae]
MRLNNLIRLTAQLAEIGTLRYTPAGIPVLDIVLKHESWQEENGQKCLVKFDMPARILGKHAEEWQYRQDMMVEAEGFLAQRSQRFPRPILRIQNIKEYKG